jgi:glycosyltransferase involved in cell wall biosynthesis
MVIVEALASGVPEVAVEDTVFFNVVENGINGYLVKKEPVHFAEKVVRLLSKPHQLAEMKKYARQSSKRFAVAATTEMLIGVYEEIIAMKKAQRHLLQIIYSGFNKKLAKDYLTLRELLDQELQKIK